MPPRRRPLLRKILFVPGTDGVADIDVGEPGYRRRRVSTALAWLRTRAPLPRPRAALPVPARTKLKALMRPKHNCWFKRNKLLSLIYRRVGDGRPCSRYAQRQASQRRPDALTVKEAAKKAKIAGLATA